MVVLWSSWQSAETYCNVSCSASEYSKLSRRDHNRNQLYLSGCKTMKNLTVHWLLYYVKCNLILIYASLNLYILRYLNYGFDAHQKINEVVFDFSSFMYWSTDHQ